MHIRQSHLYSPPHSASPLPPTTTTTNPKPKIPTSTTLKVILLSLLPLSLALTNDAFSKPLGLKAIIELGQIGNDLSARLHDGFLGGDGAVCLNAQLERSEERVRHLVRRKHDGGVLEEPLCE